jgi:hypothetical protein
MFVYMHIQRRHYMSFPFDASNSSGHGEEIAYLNILITVMRTLGYTKDFYDKTCNMVEYKKLVTWIDPIIK